MLDDLSIDTQDLRIKLAPSLSGIFEPVSGVMFLNVTDAEFEAMRKTQDPHDPLLEVFTHEMYHCFQAYTCGYQFERVCLLRDVFVAEYSPRKLFPVAALRFSQYVSGKLNALVAACLPRIFGNYLRMRHFMKTQLKERKRLAQLAKENQPSMIGARFPNLHRKLSELKRETMLPGQQGLSVNDLIESAAAVYARLSVQSVDMDAKQLLEDLSGMSETYTRVLRITVDLCGQRATRILLPATALALRYQHPENAYIELATRIEHSDPGAELETAKKMAADLPSIKEAGRVVGTAVDAAKRMRRPTKMYLDQMDALRSGTWGIDELDLLSKPDAINSIPPGSLGFGLVTRSGNPRGFKDGAGTLVIASTILRGGPSLNQVQGDVDQSILRFAADLLASNGFR
jgi:hypothetical protein